MADPDHDALRAVADAAGVDVGAAVSPGPLHDDPTYRRLLREEFSMVTTENALKWGALTDDGDRYDFRDADAILDFAADADQAVRGHALLWHRNVPGDVRPWRVDAADLREHVHTVAGRYRGRVDHWDVVNEAVADPEEDGYEAGSVPMRETLWHRQVEDYVARAFEYAADVSDAALFYNDYGIAGNGAKTDAVHDLLADLLDRGVPVDGVGLQCHCLGSVPAPDDVAAAVERFRDLGLAVHVTELDVAYSRGEAPDDHDAAQAEDYRRLVEAAVGAGCEAVVVWGVTDRYSWVRSFSDFPERFTGDPLLFDDGGSPKPAHRAIREALASAGD